MRGDWVFDAEHSKKINEARLTILSNLMPDLIRESRLRNALDAGCGVGIFSGYLSDVGLETGAFDARPENIAEAEKRHPDVKFHVHNVEDPAVRNLGTFDMVLCFGLLYHLENPFRAIRNLQDMTRYLMLIESMVIPSQAPIASLRSETLGRDQSLEGVAFVPSEACLVKMLYTSGFAKVYKLTTLPDHDDYRETSNNGRRRTMLAASKTRLRSNLFRLVPNSSLGDPWEGV